MNIKLWPFMLLMFDCFGLFLQLRSYKKSDGAKWERIIETKCIDPQKLAIIICDMWNFHWCKDAAERACSLSVRINKLVNEARKCGIHIIHAPSGLLPASKRQLRSQLAITPPEGYPLKDFYPIAPVNSCLCGAGCHCPSSVFCALHIPACCLSSASCICEYFLICDKQNNNIEIKNDELVSDNGDKIYNFISQKGIETVFIVGIHLNMCVFSRSFGIKPMVERGVKMVLIRDLTTVFPDPNLLAYVSCEIQTAIFIDWLEKYWCPSISGDELIAAMQSL